MFRKKKDNLTRSNSGSELVNSTNTPGGSSNSPTTNNVNDSVFQNNTNNNNSNNNNNNSEEQQQEFTIGFYGSSHIFASQQMGTTATATTTAVAPTNSFGQSNNGFLGMEDFGNYLIPKALQDLYNKQSKDANLISPSQPNIDPFEDEFFQNSGKLHENEETLDASYQTTTTTTNSNDQELIMEIRKKKQSEKENIKLKDNQKVEKEGWLIKEGKTVRSWKRRWFILSKETLSYYTARKNKFKGIISLGDYDIQMSKDRIDNRQCMELVLRNPTASSFTGSGLSRENSEGIITTPNTDTSRDSIDLSQMGDDKRGENGEMLLGRTFFIDAETLLEKAEWFTAIENKISFLKYLRKCTARREPVDIAMVELFEKPNNNVFDLSRDLFVGNEELMEVTMDGLAEQLKQMKQKQEEALKKRAATVVAKKEEEESAATTTPQPQPPKDDSKEDKDDADSTATSAKVKQLKKDHLQGKMIDPKTYALTIDAVYALKDPIRNNLALKKLILKGCRIGNEGLQQLCEALLGVSSTTRISNPNYSGAPTTQLTEIDLSGCALVGMSEGLQTFVTVLNEIKSIEVINLSYNMLDDACIELLCKPALENTISVKRLSLHYNAIGDKGCAVLVNTLIHNKYLSIQELELSHNLISDDGAKAIAKLMEEQQQQPPSSTKCHSFHLGYNSIGNDGVKAIAGALEKNSYVMSLNLESNEITYKGIKDLAFMMVKNAKIHTLNLGGNKLGDQGLTLLANTNLEFAEFELKSDA